MTMTIMFTVIQAQAIKVNNLVSWVTELCQMQEGLEVFLSSLIYCNGTVMKQN